MIFLHVLAYSRYPWTFSHILRYGDGPLIPVTGSRHGKKGMEHKKLPGLGQGPGLGLGRAGPGRAGVEEDGLEPELGRAGPMINFFLSVHGKKKVSKV